MTEAANKLPGYPGNSYLGSPKPYVSLLDLLEWDGGWVGKDETIGELKRNGIGPNEDLAGHDASTSSRTYIGPAGPWGRSVGPWANVGAGRRVCSKSQAKTFCTL